MQVHHDGPIVRGAQAMRDGQVFHVILARECDVVQHGHVPCVLPHAQPHGATEHDVLQRGELALDGALGLVHGGAVLRDGFASTQTLQGGQVDRNHELAREGSAPYHETHGAYRKDGNGYTYRDHGQTRGSHHGHQSLASTCTAFRICHRGAEDAPLREPDGGRNAHRDGQHGSDAARSHRNEAQSPESQGSVRPLGRLRLRPRPRETSAFLEWYGYWPHRQEHNLQLRVGRRRML